MTGKVFQQSANVYQDQAKLLFDYYLQAADKIVQEEERIEKEVTKLKEERAMVEAQMSKLWYWFLTIILFFVYFIKKSKLQKEIDGIDARIQEFELQHKNIFRDYKVSKMGVVYTPIANQVKYENKSFIVDYTGSVPMSEVTLQMSRQNELLVETIAELEKLSSGVPLVETSKDSEKIDTDNYSSSIQEINQHDYIGKLDHALRTIAYCMGDLDTSSVSLPLVSDNCEYQAFLNEYATKHLPANAAVMKVFDDKRYEECINKFQSLNHMKDALSTKTKQFEDVLKDLMKTMAGSVQAISALKVASVDKVVFESNKLLYQILKAPYNHYSPVLEHDEIERIRLEKFDYSDDVQGYEPFQLKPSSRVRFNMASGLWTAEDGSTTTMPFGVHQIYEEIVAPVVQNLMAENRIERLKIYNNIRDQKISYLNKWHQDTDAFYRANRAESSQLISQMQESLREYVAAYNTLISLQQTEANMQQTQSLDSANVKVIDNTSETIATFETKSQQFRQTQDDFEEYIERLKDDIDIKAARFEHIEYYDAKLRDAHFNDVAVASSPAELNNMDERSRPLALANPLIAKTSQLPPAPKVDDVMYEHFSLNLPGLAKQSLATLDAMLETGNPNAKAEITEVVPDLENIEVSGSNNIAGNDPIDDNQKTDVVEDEIQQNQPAEDDIVEEPTSDTVTEAVDETTEESSIPEESEALEEEEVEEEDVMEIQFYTKEELQSLSDEDLKALLDQYYEGYDFSNYVRANAIADILEAQEEVMNEAEENN